MYSCRIKTGKCSTKPCKEKEPLCANIPSNNITLDMCNQACETFKRDDSIPDNHILPGVPTPSKLIPGVPTPNKKKDKLDPGIIVIIVLGCLSAVILIVLLVSKSRFKFDF